MRSASSRLAISLVALTAVLATSGVAGARPRATVTPQTPASTTDTDRARAATTWSAGWAAPVQRPSAGFEENWSEAGFDRQTVRQVVRVTGGGSAARIKLSNRYGERPLRISGATIARSAGGAAVRPQTLRKLSSATARR